MGEAGRSGQSDDDDTPSTFPSWVWHALRLSGLVATARKARRKAGLIIDGIFTVIM